MIWPQLWHINDDEKKCLLIIKSIEFLAACNFCRLEGINISQLFGWPQLPKDIPCFDSCNQRWLQESKERKGSWRNIFSLYLARPLLLVTAHTPAKKISINTYVAVSMTSLLPHTVAQPTQWRFLRKNLSQLVIFVIELALTWSWGDKNRAQFQ